MSLGDDDRKEERTKRIPEKNQPKSDDKNSPWQWWRLPAPVKRIFDEFPLKIYSANQLPQRTVTFRDEHTLFVFIGEGHAKSGGPSYNPGCLKWQVCNVLISFERR